MFATSQRNQPQYRDCSTPRRAAGNCVYTCPGPTSQRATCTASSVRSITHDSPGQGTSGNTGHEHVTGPSLQLSCGSLAAALAPMGDVRQQTTRHSSRVRSSSSPLIAGSLNARGCTVPDLYDLIVQGMGVGGVEVARQCARTRMSVLAMEQRLVGGQCPLLDWLYPVSLGPSHSSRAVRRAFARATG